jgi:hypothetical protein
MASYGPNSALVEQFLFRLASLTLAQLGTVVATWRERLRLSDAWYAAEDAVGDAIAATRRHDEQWRLQSRLYELFRRAPWFTERQPSASVSGTEAAAQYVASTAAFALMVVDELDPESFATLYAPFGEMIPVSDLGLGGARLRSAPPGDKPPRPSGDAGERGRGGGARPE